MAEMIPEYLPDHASQGEKAVFAALQQLDDKALVFYEPVVQRRYPDFIVIHPEFGVVIIEVKGWRASWLLSVSPTEVHYRMAGQERADQHPSNQARQYMTRLMSACQSHPLASNLLSNGRFTFAFSHLAILTGASRSDLREHGVDSWFPPPATIAADEWEEIQAGGSNALWKALAAARDPALPHQKLGQEQIQTLRAVIHPVSVISGRRTEAGHADLSGQNAPDLKLMDYNQERYARDMRPGHRVIYGVAGSGKTVILLARARLLSENPNLRILVLCYNLGLKDYLSSQLADRPNVHVDSFGNWARGQGAPVDLNDAENFGVGLLTRLQRGEAHAGKFDAVLIDEGQDFSPSWFRCAVEALKDPRNSDLLIMFDVSQSLYGRRPISWAPLGVRIRGGAGGSKTERLEINYRNTFEIVSVARAFASTDGVDGEDGIVIDPASCKRHGPWPIAMSSPNRSQAIEACAKLVSELLTNGTEVDGRRVAAAVDQIRIIYPRNEAGLAGELRSALSRRGLDNQQIGTAHSSKGLQAKVVIFLCADLLPSQFPDRDEAAERALFYVALTRAEELLVVIYSHGSPYVSEFVAALDSARTGLA